jgi:hypothetical protein
MITTLLICVSITITVGVAIVTWAIYLVRGRINGMPIISTDIQHIRDNLSFSLVNLTLNNNK